ncbi:MAG: hypothetical protein ACKVOU_05345, partial [Cytophagales bacterium]
MYFTKTVPTICKNIVAAAICTAVFANAAFAQTLLTAGGTADAITVTYPANITAAVPGISFTFKAISTNTGPSTLDLNGTGAATIYKNGNFPVQAGDIKAGAFVTVIFDGTDWQMLSVGGNEVGTGNVTGAGAIGNIAYWTSGSNLGQDSNLFWDTANEYLGIGTSSPSGDLSFGPNGAARVIQVEADLSANNGTDLLVQAGGAGVAGLNRTGGNLTLSSGNSTGNVGSRIEFLTPVPGVSGNTSNTITPKMVILGNGNVGIGTGTPAQQLELNNGNLLLSSTATLGSELRFEEGTSTPGDHYTAFRAGDQAVNITYTLPLTAPITGQMLAAGATPTNLTWANAGISGTGTTGGVSFFSNNNTITADGANFFWDNTNKRLGIGTSAPLEALDIFSSTSTNVIDLRSTGSIVRFVNNA